LGRRKREFVSEKGKDGKGKREGERDKDEK